MSDDPDRIERQVIRDVLDTVDARLRELERRGWQLTVPRSHVYAAVLHMVIVSARASHRVPATLDRADILDAILDGIESADGSAADRLVDHTIKRYAVHVN
ncbi:hypothetical protein D7D52_26065 [Nocardia yunnanensis]|uniref:Uncharacterized protein n=1 Tax=Nocardia yunnanensis TaxID=2382165 RepID=A0A386ZGT0_9NOCA|nr:hypothetical protein [Nocardia yunnanensis]AYF76707.1 hypothetical protein D7D52_26065 [Nocardia yunnanensis]